MIEKLERVNALTILVVGDLMLDEYIVGKNYRMSDEAPVPILRVDDFKVHLGGAANVANNLKALGVNVILSGTLGIGYSSDRVLGLLDDARISNEHVILSESNFTTTKTRVLIRNQQIVRYDYEKTVLGESVVEELNRDLVSLDYSTIDVILISDYNKGVISADIVDTLKSTGKTIIVDPKPSHIDLYNNIFCCTPNINEFMEMTGMKNREDLSAYAKAFIKVHNIELLIVTLGKEGAFIYYEKEHKFIKGEAKEIANMIGAGDTFTACFAAAIAAEMNGFEAVRLANMAAGIVVSKNHTSVCSLQELLLSLKKDLYGRPQMAS